MKHKMQLLFSPLFLLTLLLQTSGWAGMCSLCEAGEMAYEAMPKMESCHGESTAADVQEATFKLAGCDCCAVLQCAEVISYPQELVDVAEPTAQRAQAVFAHVKSIFNNQVFSTAAPPGKYKEKRTSTALFILHRSLLI
jgi:hypothetical protein